MGAQRWRPRQPARARIQWQPPPMDPGKERSRTAATTVTRTRFATSYTRTHTSLQQQRSKVVREAATRSQTKGYRAALTLRALRYGGTHTASPLGLAYRSPRRKRLLTTKVMSPRLASLLHRGARHFLFYYTHDASRVLRDHEKRNRRKESTGNQQGWLCMQF